MREIKLNTARQAFPMLYAYSTPQIAEHDGWTKIGYTEAKDVDTRIKEQTKTSDIEYKLEWKGAAIFDDGSGECFTDKQFHGYLRKSGIENKPKTEWFHIDGPSGRAKFYDFRADRGILKATDVIPYTLREEQARAVRDTAVYRAAHEGGAYLWNAKPRFGKTLSVYDLCKTLRARNVLIVTNRPAIANSWYSDYCQFLGDASGFKFVSETEALKGQPCVLSRAEYINVLLHSETKYGCIEFLSLQDLKGSLYFGGKYDKLEEIKDIDWDILVIDEAHEGVDTLKTDTAFDHIKRKFTLHLSGTPFKALANDKFPGNAIFNWTYADEQDKKRNWNEAEGNNPYASMPFLNLYTYLMSDIVSEQVDKGIEINGETEEYAFDLALFFATDGRGKFVHEESVDRFLDAMTTQKKFPFSTPELRDELKHTFWLLNRVDSAKALAVKLKEHPVFKEYEIVLAAGDGKLDDAEETEKSFDKVREAIRTHDKTITLSVGQLTTGITVPEWTAVMMLSNIKSPALYMQAAFRSQNPCMFRRGEQYWRKENAYVFDFDPARTLTIFEEFANDLSSDTANGKGDLETRRKNVRELLNFFPVIGEDENGEMIKLDAEKVLSIPRKIRSQEVVRRGFMSNYLFQNIGNVFNAPQTVIEILSRFQPLEEPKAKDIPVTDTTAADLNIDPETGEVVLPPEQVIGTAAEMFGDPIYADIENGSLDGMIEDAFSEARSATETKSAFDEFSERFKAGTVSAMVERAKENYGEQLRARDVKEIKKDLESKFDTALQKEKSNYEIEQKVAEHDYMLELRDREKSGRTAEEITAAYTAKQEELKAGLEDKLHDMVDDFVHSSAEAIVERSETKIKEREKNSIEDSIKDHLRGFARTIPSFLMAYGNDTVTLATFDTVIPDNVFLEVTSITLDEFRFLRDGGEFTNEETGEKEYFAGNLFDPVVFDDSVREFMRMKVELADYFDESHPKDIFDYIPPQKTNQIYTPKKTVKMMVDMLEKENPGCFDDPEKTFIDLYMKSGLYITEIVKRLFNSEEMKIWFPDPQERLKHIFAKQVYGLAPTEIIYRIATEFILGFDKENWITVHNLRFADALPYAKEGNLPELIGKLFPEMK